MYRVLIIDEDAVFGCRAVRCLERDGFAAQFHHGPFGSLHAIRETRSDIVLVDIDMPRLDGGLLVKMVRVAYGLGQTRVMLVGNRPEAQLAELASTVGADGYLSKLIADPDLIHRVRSMALTSYAASAAAPH